MTSPMSLSPVKVKRSHTVPGIGKKKKARKDDLGAEIPEHFLFTVKLDQEGKEEPSLQPVELPPVGELVLATTVKPFGKHGFGIVGINLPPSFNMPSLMLRLPLLRIAFEPSMYNTSHNEGGIGSVQLALSLQEAVDQLGVRQVLQFFQSLDEQIRKHMVAHRKTLFPANLNSSNDQLVGKYEPVTAVRVGTDGSIYAPLLRVKIKRTSEFELARTSDSLRVTDLDDFSKLGPLKNLWIACMLEVSHIMVRNNGATWALALNLTYGKIYDDHSHTSYLEKTATKAVPSEILFGSAVTQTAAPAIKPSAFSDLF